MQVTIPPTSESIAAATEMQDVNIPEADMQHDKATENHDEIAKTDMYDEDDEEEDQQNPVSPQVVAEYRTLVQMFGLDQTVFKLLDDHDDILTLFPDLILYTAPDCDSIGNDPYFDEAEYSRIVPFKLSTQRLILQKRCRKRDSEGHSVYHCVPDEEENIKVLPRHERYDCAPQLSRKFTYPFIACTDN